MRRRSADPEPLLLAEPMHRPGSRGAPGAAARDVGYYDGGHAADGAPGSGAGLARCQLDVHQPEGPPVASGTSTGAVPASRAPRARHRAREP
jgi:hypothetical protein